jgi:hypothetical protein
MEATPFEHDDVVAEATYVSYLSRKWLRSQKPPVSPESNRLAESLYEATRNAVFPKGRSYSADTQRF